MKIDPNRHDYAFYCDLFGEVHDIYIAKNGKTTMYICSNMGFSF
jgi:hypothetical protein